jgi:hypothetical protein
MYLELFPYGLSGHYFSPTSISQMRKLRLKEVTILVHGITAPKRPGWIETEICLTSELVCLAALFL